MTPTTVAAPGRAVDLDARRVLSVTWRVVVGAVLVWFGRELAPLEDGAGIGWSLVAVLVTIGSAATAGGIDPAAVRRWVVEHRVGLALLVGPALLSWALVEAGVRTAAWLTDPTPVAALGLGLVLSAVPLSRGRR